METTVNARQISILTLKTEHARIVIKKLVIKYCYGKTVSSTSQKAAMKVILGLSHQFIQKPPLGFNAEQIRMINIRRVTPYFEN